MEMAKIVVPCANLGVENNDSRRGKQVFGGLLPEVHSYLNTGFTVDLGPLGLSRC